MLTSLLDGFFKVDIGEGAFFAVFGFIFVFLGIALLILIFTCFGLIMKRIAARKKQEAPVVVNRGGEKTAPAEEKQAEEGLSPALVAVITAAIAAYYEGEKQKCDFVVRRIKRL